MFVEKINKTVRIEASTVDIEERGVKLKLTVVDTPGFGDAMNCDSWFVLGCFKAFNVASQQNSLDQDQTDSGPGHETQD